MAYVCVVFNQSVVICLFFRLLVLAFVLFPPTSSRPDNQEFTDISIALLNNFDYNKDAMIKRNK
jgi:hypothetical protein